MSVGGRQRHIADHDSTDAEIIDVLLPVQDLRRENQRLRKELIDVLSASAREAERVEHMQALVEAQGKVVDAAKELARHDCQSCREHWCDPRESIVMTMAIAIDKLPWAQPPSC